MGPGRALALRKKWDPFKSQCAEDREERERRRMGCGALQSGKHSQETQVWQAEARMLETRARVRVGIQRAQGDTSCLGAMRR